MSMQPCRNECSALLEFLLSTMQVLKLSKIHFVEYSVFLDRPSPRPHDACQFCFTLALEVALFAGGMSCFAAV